MVKKDRYVEPDIDFRPIEYTVTEDEIIAKTWDYFCSSMKKVGKENLITKQACIDDFIIVNWAEEVK